MIEVQGSIKKPGAESHSITLATIGSGSHARDSSFANADRG